MDITLPATRRARRNRLLIALGIAAAINVAFAASLVGVAGSSTASAAQSPVTVKIEDDCDPTTFDAVLGAGACIGDGETTFEELIGQVAADKNAPKWRFSRTSFGITSGRHIAVPNRGGEFHTFTEVANFGGGCVPELNHLMGLTPVPECDDEIAPGVPKVFATTGVKAGESIHVHGLAKGTHKFECLIHPWMRSTVTVR